MESHGVYFTLFTFSMYSTFPDSEETLASELCFLSDCAALRSGGALRDFTVENV